MGIKITHIKTEYGNKMDEVDLAERISLYLTMNRIEADVSAEERI